ncbi:DUF4097 family beta strand repeat-containing protein [Winogradskyella tangerina]|uniref:hypothetical protein n=1 Tax=Winogradskyella tangerina TaxID=2023240 RepID=UPI0013001DBA|nr:hypothetical protein [Winogradskyella tangerina]
MQPLALKLRTCRNNMCPHKIIKPWNLSFKAFLLVFSFGLHFGIAQNTLRKELDAATIETISIKGNQIFNILVTTSSSKTISITSTLDGEYQNNYQIATKQEQNELILSLEFMSFEAIPDDKRNAHKVIAAELKLDIPKDLDLKIKSDVGSVEVAGQYNSLSIELLQGFCNVDAHAKNAAINTIDGNIDVKTKNASVTATSKNGKVAIEDLNTTDWRWNLRSINGDITVIKKE